MLSNTTDQGKEIPQKLRNVVLTSRYEVYRSCERLNEWTDKDEGNKMNPGNEEIGW